MNKNVVLFYLAVNAMSAILMLSYKDPVVQHCAVVPMVSCIQLLHIYVNLDDD
jgi:hypothetical protein